MKKNVHVLKIFLKISRAKQNWDHAQIPCQNAKIKKFDSSLNTNMQLTD
jgi:hypothetical protein